MSFKQVNKILDNNIENKKANIWFVTNTLSTIFGMISGFLIIKLTISFYGEPVNGIARFINQFFAYIVIVQGTFSLAFTVRMIQYYKQNEYSKLNWMYKNMKTIFNVILIAYVFIFFATGALISYLLHTSTISFGYVYLMFIALGSNTIFNLSIFARYQTYFTSINKAYIVDTVFLFIKFILFIYLLLILILFPPQLTWVVNDNHKISVFNPNDWRIYNWILGIFIYSLSPLFTGLIIRKLFHKNMSHNLKMFKYTELSKKEKQIIKKSFWNAIKWIFLLGICSLIMNSTDEFVILLLKNKDNDIYILKQISIYGIYISICGAIQTILITYLLTRRVLMGTLTTHDQQLQKYMAKLKSTTLMLATCFVAISFFTVPIIVNALFNPNSNLDYFNVKFSTPIIIALFLTIIFTPNLILFEVNAKFKSLTLVSFIEAGINIVLSASLIRILGIYWVLWATIISRCVKIIMFEFIIYKSSNMYTSIINIQMNKKFIFTNIFILLVILQYLIYLFFNINALLMFVRHHPIYIYIFIQFSLIISIYILYIIRKAWIKLYNK